MKQTDLDNIKLDKTELLQINIIEAILKTLSAEVNPIRKDIISSLKKALRLTHKQDEKDKTP